MSQKASESDRPANFNRPPACLVFFGLEADCQIEQLHAAYHRLAQEMHPDAGGDAKQFKKLQANYSRATQFVKKRAKLGNVKPHNFQLSPFLNFREERAKFWKRFAIGSGITSLGLLVAWSLGFGGLATLVCFFAAVIIVLPVLLSSLRPMAVGIIFLTMLTIFLVLAASTADNDDLLQWVSNPKKKIARNHLIMICIQVGLFATTLGCGIGWLISFANHDDS